MKYDENYNYKIISENDFDNKYLLCKNDGSKYKKYILVFYKENNVIKSEELPNGDYMDRYSNIVSSYEVEEIISSCIGFDSAFKYKKYYEIKNKLCFIKYKYLDECISFKNDNEQVKQLLENL